MKGKEVKGEKRERERERERERGGGGGKGRLVEVIERNMTEAQ